jgi:hypothetical protein
MIFGALCYSRCEKKSGQSDDPIGEVERIIRAWSASLDDFLNERQGGFGLSAHGWHRLAKVYESA